MIGPINTTIGNVDNDCQYGGVSRVWVIARTAAVITYDATNNTVITAISAGTAKASEIVVRDNSADYTSAFTEEGADVFYLQTLNFTVAGNDPLTNLAQKQLDLNKHLFIVERESGELEVLGAGSAGLRSKSTSGAKSGANGKVFVATGKAKAPSHSITQSILDSLLA